MERGYYWVKHPTGDATPILFWNGEKWFYGNSPYHEQNMTPIGDRLAPPVPEREPGYYWVEGDIIALWSDGGYWLVQGDDLVPISERLAPPAVDTGWFTWDGWGAPPNGRVDIRYRDGDTVIENVSPEQYRWTHIDSPGDIVAYRYVR